MGLPANLRNMGKSPKRAGRLSFSDIFPSAPKTSTVLVSLTKQHIFEGSLVRVPGQFSTSDNPVALAIAEALGQEPESVEAYAGRWNKNFDDPDQVADVEIMLLPDDIRVWLECWNNYESSYCIPCTFKLTTRKY